jgi:hypothetical protein
MTDELMRRVIALFEQSRSFDGISKLETAHVGRRQPKELLHDV